MFEFAEQSIFTVGARVNNPCTRRRSLLKISARAAQCMADQNRVRPHPLFQASSCFEKNPQQGVWFYTNAKSISWGVRERCPNRNDSFRPDGHAVRQPKEKFAPTFFEGKRRRKNSKHTPHIERTQSALTK